MIGRHPSKTLDLSSSDITCFKYAPFTSVERSFSRFRNIARLNRRHLTFGHSKKIVIIQCNTPFGEKFKAFGRNIIF